ALHFVGAAAEGEDERGTVEELDAAAEHGGAGVAGEAGALAEDLHQGAVAFDVKLAGEHLDGRGVGEIDPAVRHAPGLAPGEQPQNFPLRPHPGEVQLYPLLV